MLSHSIRAVRVASTARRAEGAAPEPPFNTLLIPIIAENLRRDDPRIEIIECLHNSRFCGSPIACFPWPIGGIRKRVRGKADRRFLFGMSRPFIYVGAILLRSLAKDVGSQSSELGPGRGRVAFRGLVVRTPTIGGAKNAAVESPGAVTHPGPSPDPDKEISTIRLLR